MKKAHELHEFQGKKMQGCMILVLCRGLIYQAQPQAIHLPGLMNQTPMEHGTRARSTEFCVLVAIIKAENKEI